MLNNERFSERLRGLRKKAGLNQTELAELIGVSTITVCRWETEARAPRMGDIAKLASALHVSEAELLNGPERREFEVQILMGVKTVGNMAGVEVRENSFIYGVQDDKPLIHLAGKVLIGTPEERETAKEMLLKRFDEACWMYDHQGAIPATA